MERSFEDNNCRNPSLGSYKSYPPIIDPSIWSTSGSNGSSSRASYIPYPNNGPRMAGSSSCSSVISSTCSTTPVELQVTNLDQTIDQREMKNVVSALFREHVEVNQVSVFFQSDGNMAACVRVPSLHDAQIAISRLHRKKVGYKRIVISYSSHSHGQNLSVLRSKVVSLLSDVPSRKLQLFKFREMFEKRFHNSIGVSDLYKMKDIVLVTDEDTGRMVSLLHDSSYDEYDTIKQGLFSSFVQSNIPPSELDPAYCPKHSSSHTTLKGWAEKENETHLPLINIRLSTLAKNMRTLLTSHGGSVPLASLVHCYNADFEPELSIDPENGVPMEHLLSCISKDLIIHYGLSGVKKISLGDSSADARAPLPPPPLAGQLSQFSRELIDLLRSSPGCRMLFHKFIPSYHHHFGRQCRVADYGYTKLKELFEAIPNVVQILGEGSRCLITLSHRSQIKRFTMNLLRILKGQANKQLHLSEFESLYKEEFGIPFRIADYGVCHIDDILYDVPESSILIAPSPGKDDTLISIPKREQTSDEIERTKTFSIEVIELLRHAPDCCLPFNKFIPAYHHHFGRQCRVADYGFSKLIELFEAIPGTIDVTEDTDGERFLQLSDTERLSVIGEQISYLIRNSREKYLLLEDVSEVYMATYGYHLRPENFGVASIRALLDKFAGDLLRFEDEERVYLSDSSYVKAQLSQAKNILASKPDGKQGLEDFLKEYKDLHDMQFNLELLKNCTDVIVIDKDLICLSPLQLCIVRLQNLLKEEQSRVLLTDIEDLYLERYGVALCPNTYGYSSITALLQNFSETFSIRGKGVRKMVVLVNEYNSASTVHKPPTTPIARTPKSSSSMYLRQYSPHSKSSNYLSGSSLDSSTNVTPPVHHWQQQRIYLGNRRNNFDLSHYETSSPHHSYFGACPFVQSSPIGKQLLRGTPPHIHRRPDMNNNNNALYPAFRRSPNNNSMCESSNHSPTSSSLYTTDEEMMCCTPSSSGRFQGFGLPCRKNHSAPSLLLRHHHSPRKFYHNQQHIQSPLFSPATQQQQLFPIQHHSGPLSPISPLSPSSFNQFTFPSVATSSSFFGGGDKVLLGSIFEEMGGGGTPSGLEDNQPN